MSVTRSRAPRRRRSRFALLGAPFVAVSVAATVFLAPRGGAALPPLEPRQVFHLYFVDVAATRGRESDVVGYVAHRWGTLMHSRAAQNGRIVFLDGPNGRVSTLDLADTDDDQAAIVKRRLSLEQGSSRPATTGIDLAMIAEGIREIVDTRFDVIAATDLIRELPAQRLLFVHVITDKLQRRFGHQLRSLDEWMFPDSCVEEGVVGDAMEAFGRRGGTISDDPGLEAPRLKVAFALVPSDGRRFGDAAERSAIQVVLGRTAFDGRALALRDGLACLEVEDRIAPSTATAGRCLPVRMEPSRPARTREACVPLDAIDTRDRIAGLARSRIEQEFKPFLDGVAPAALPHGPDGGSSSTKPSPPLPTSPNSGTERTDETTRPQPLPLPATPADRAPGTSAPRPAVPASSEATTAPAPHPPPMPTQPASPPLVSPSPAPSNTAAEPVPRLPTPSPAVTAAPTTKPAVTTTAPPPAPPSPNPTAPPPTLASAPAPASPSRPPVPTFSPGPPPSAAVPTFAPTTPPRAAASPSLASAPPPVPATPSVPPSPAKHVDATPAARAPGPPSTGLRLIAAAARSLRSDATGNLPPLRGRASIGDAHLAILLVPIGKTIAETDARDVVDVTHDVWVRPKTGPHRLIARLKPGVVCGTDGRFTFSFALSGTALGAREVSEFDVEIPDACRVGGSDLPFAEVTLR